MTSQVSVKQGGALQLRPFSSAFGSLQREMDRLFDDFNPMFAAARGHADLKCKMDLAETDGGLELTVELPGLDEKDVTVSLVEGVLTVSGEKKFESEQKDKTYHFVERGYGAFSRSIPVPASVKPEDITADLSKGVLKVVIPIPAKPEAKKIEVKSAT